MVPRVRSLSGLVAVAVLGSGSAAAQSVSIDGYLRGIATARDLRYTVSGTDQRAASGGMLGRLKLGYRASETVRFDIHSRVQGLGSTADQGSGAIGFGVSAVPNRRYSLRSVLVDESHVVLTHDLDRLSVTVLTDLADITVGRQAITWGISNVFPVADLWAQFSPFELDTEEKPGIDALRALLYPADGVEVDVVVADRGSRSNLSAGARVTASFRSADVHVAAGKFWRRAMAIAGVSAVTGVWKLRGEAVVPYDVDADEIQAVRATIGVDRIGMTRTFSIEYHHNGLGTTDQLSYAGRLASAEVMRGETYYLGRHLLGGSVVHQFNEVTSLTTSALVNPKDQSGVLFPGVLYQPGNATRYTVGVLLSVGDRPRLGPFGIQVPAEFGLYGHHLFLTGSYFF